MYKQMISRFINLVEEFNCAIAVFTKDGKVLYINDAALEILGRHFVTLELVPGRYVENENYWDNLRRYRTVFTHKALLKAGHEVYKIRGMMHLLCEEDSENDVPETYALAFEVREERIFGSVTLERIVEHSGFVAIHWVADSPEQDKWHAHYVSNTVSKFGYKRDDFYKEGFNWTDFVYEDDLKRIREEMLDNIHNKKLEYNRQYRVKTVDGDVIPVHDYAHVLLDGNGRLIGVEVVIFDLLMETERNANLLLLENAVNRSSNMVMVWQDGKDAKSSQLQYVSSNVEHLGISVTKLRSGEVNYVDYIHPDDKESVLHTYAQFRQKNYQYLSQEYRIITENQQEFWVRDESNIVVIPGDTRYTESILTDITEVKKHELQLEQQQEELQRKLRYIESGDSLLNDMSVLDFIHKDNLQELQGAFAALTNSYNAIIDLDGEPITFPDGPNTNMGEFYDMFERREYKRGYFELNRQLREQKIPVYVELSQFTSKKMQAKPINVGQTRETRKMTEFANISAEKQEGATAGVVVGIPLLIDDKHTATWINCAFTQEEVRRVDAYLPALWVICRYMAQFVYSNTIAEKQAQKTRLSEIQARELLERSATIRDILRRCNETNEENVLAYVLQKVGEFLKLSRISLFRYTDTMSMPTCWYEWDSKGMKQNVDVHSGIYTPEYFNQQRDAFERNGRTVYDGDKIPIRLRRVLSESLIRAIVAMPIYTLTEEKQYIIFVESNYERVWTEDELSFMNSAVSILQGFLQRMRSNVNVHDVTETKMQFLDLSRDYIYIKNEDTEEIVYVNPRLEELIGKDAVGKKCYEVFRHQSIRCMDCYQKKDECRELVNSWMYRKVFNRAMRVREQQTSWNGNGHMKMVLLSPEDK